MRMSPIGKSGQFLFPQPFECNHKRHLLKSYDLSFYFQIDVTSFAKNCHEDTCNCNLGGDCECLCTSVAAYAYKCCQEGVPVRWRSPTVCGGYLASDVIKWIVFKKIRIICRFIVEQFHETHGNIVFSCLHFIVFWQSPIIIYQRERNLLFSCMSDCCSCNFWNRNYIPSSQELIVIPILLCLWYFILLIIRMFS